jgi:hypothetical protein
MNVKKTLRSPFLMASVPLVLLMILFGSDILTGKEEGQLSYRQSYQAKRYGGGVSGTPPVHPMAEIPRASFRVYEVGYEPCVTTDVPFPHPHESTSGSSIADPMMPGSYVIVSFPDQHHAGRIIDG